MTKSPLRVLSHELYHTHKGVLLLWLLLSLSALYCVMHWRPSGGTATHGSTSWCSLARHGALPTNRCDTATHAFLAMPHGMTCSVDHPPPPHNASVAQYALDLAPPPRPRSALRTQHVKAPGAFADWFVPAQHSPEAVADDRLILYSLRNWDLLLLLDLRGAVAGSYGSPASRTAPEDVGTTRATSFVAPVPVNATHLLTVARRRGEHQLVLLALASGALTRIAAVAAGSDQLLHHALAYNPVTRSLMCLKGYLFKKSLTGWARDAVMWLDHALVEFDLNGRRLWQLELRPLLWPYFERIRRDAGHRCHRDADVEKCGDWLHPNSLYWDVAEGALFLNSKALDTFFKIRLPGGTVEWAVGRVGEFALFENGTQVPSLFTAAHEVTRIAEDTFLLFDNMYHSNATDPPVPQDPRPARVLQVRVDAQQRTASVVWAWQRPHATPNMGSAQRLPSGNVLAHFPYAGATYEVTAARATVWQMRVFQPLQNVSEMSLSYRATAFYARPLIRLLRPEVVAPHFSLQAHVWDVVPRSVRLEGRAVLVGVWGQRYRVLHDGCFEYHKYWQPTPLHIPLRTLNPAWEYRLHVSSAEGPDVSSTLAFTLRPGPS